MGEILGIGVTHFPGLMLPDAYMSSFLTRTLKSERVPTEMRSRRAGPSRYGRSWPPIRTAKLPLSIAAASLAASARRARHSMRSRPILC
jgi:hypothetical protein